MAIGTAAAIGLGVAGVGSFLSSKSQSNAAGQAADISAQTAADSNALHRYIYDQNKEVLSPSVTRGNAAGDTMNALLGLGGTQTQQVQPNALSQFGGGQVSAQDYYGLGDGFAGFDPYEAFRRSGEGFGGFGGIPQLQNNALSAVGGNSGGQVGQTAQSAAEDAFGIYRNSTGYNFRLNEGMDALNSGLASSGILQSGAAMKEAQRYGQNFASNEFGNYMGMLGNQQGVGLSAAGAQAGVGVNYANSVSANNNSAGTTAANAALAQGANNPFANVLGTVGGAALGGVFG